MVFINVARPASEYHEDMGPVLWWKFPVDEPPYVGGPNDLGQSVVIGVHTFGKDHSELRVYVGGWPGYHTHFTPISMPCEPPPDASPPGSDRDPEYLRQRSEHPDE